MDPSEFHRIVETGTLDQLREALTNRAKVNAPGPLQQTPLMAAIAAADLEKTKLLIDHGADPELTDEFNATALRHAVDRDFADGVQFLLGLGVDRGYDLKYPLKKVDYKLEGAELDLPKELSEFMSADEWEESRRFISELGQHPTAEPTITAVQSVAVLKLFLEAGDDLSLAPSDVLRTYMGLPNEGVFFSSPADYREHKSHRDGTRNPEHMDNPFWSDMIRLGCSAYSAREYFDDTDPFSNTGAVWCYDRFGSSVTELPDGRFVQIAGEHEDHYDPDFQIYNDVVIHDGQGSFQVYGYPKDVFPPTDFHTATRVGEWIYVVGCLGYPDQRQVGRTPVYRLKLESWQIEHAPTSGEMPSWLHRHRSRYDPGNNVIQVDGGDVLVDSENDSEIVPNECRFELDLSSLQWRRLN